MSLTIALASGLGYGVLHGLGPDHCAALASLAVRGDTRHAAALGFRFGLSHAAALSALTVLAVAFGVSVSPELSRGFEVFGGAVLLVLGVVALVSDGVVVTLHHHDGEHAEGSAWHTHLGGASWLGGMFAASGVRALLLLVAPLLAGTEGWLHGATFVIAFGLGVMAAMIACGIALAFVQGALPLHARRWLARGVGVLSVAVGGYWIAASLPSR